MTATGAPLPATGSPASSRQGGLAPFDPDRLPEGALLDPLLACISPGLAQLRDYWRARCAGRPMPARSDIRFADVAPVMPMVFIAEVIDGGRDFRMRLVGTALTRVIGGDPSNSLASERAGEPLTERFVWYMRRALLDRAPLRILTERAVVEAVEFMRGENLVLPLSADGVAIDQFLVGCDLLKPVSLGGGPSDTILPQSRRPGGRGAGG